MPQSSRFDRSVAVSSFDQMWHSLLPIGLETATGGYRRFAWTDADRACRDWFVAQAKARGLDVVTDRNGNQWATWGEPTASMPAVVTGSHLDSVPDGGAYDGPLGVISAFSAFDLMRAANVVPVHPLAIVNFADEEGARFGVACCGSRLMTGSLDPEHARNLTDDDGITLAAAMTDAGVDAAQLGRDDGTIASIAVFVELHIEQGRWLVGRDAAVGVATGIWPHGRFRFDFTGEANHAGTTRLDDRNDPMLSFAEAVRSARVAAQENGALATFGRVLVQPNGTNAISSRVTAWLDARAEDETDVGRVVAAVRAATSVDPVEESWSPAVVFDESLRDRVVQSLGGVPTLPTGAGHDAGVLAAAAIPTAMLFVRNPTGVSHSPSESADVEDCLAGIGALATVLSELIT